MFPLISNNTSLDFNTQAVNFNTLFGFNYKRVEMHKNWKFKTGILLIILASILFISLLAVPFLDISGKTKITITTVIIVLGEITFWSGGILLGKELFSKYKAYFNPTNWFRKKTVPASADHSETDESSDN